MNKTTHRKVATYANRKSVAKSVTLKQTTAAGVSYTVRYPTPKKRTGYQPNASSQFGVPEISLGSLGATGW